MSVRMIKGILPMALLILMPTTSLAEGDDFGLDFSIEAQKKLSKRWSIGLEGELRRRDNAAINDRWSVGLSGDYKLTKWMKASAGYTYLYDNNVRTTYYDSIDDAVLDGDAETGDPKKRAQYWGARHRLNVSLVFDKKLIGDFRFSLRERWQYTYRPEYTINQRWSFLNGAYDGKPKTYSGKGKNVLRSRLQIEYDKKGLKLNPYLSVELYNAWSTEKVRYQAGVDYTLTKQHSVGAFYRYQKVNDNDDFDLEPDIHLIGFGYKFKF